MGLQYASLTPALSPPKADVYQENIKRPSVEVVTGLTTEFAYKPVLKGVSRDQKKHGPSNF
jgi:hypothetical protein